VSERARGSGPCGRPVLVFPERDPWRNGIEFLPQAEKIIRTTPLKKPGRPEDIAEMVLFLATSAEYITGQVFAVDGCKSIPYSGARPSP